MSFGHPDESLTLSPLRLYKEREDLLDVQFLLPKPLAFIPHRESVRGVSDTHSAHGLAVSFLGIFPQCFINTTTIKY